MASLLKYFYGPVKRDDIVNKVLTILIRDKSFVFVSLVCRGGTRPEENLAFLMKGILVFYCLDDRGLI